MNERISPSEFDHIISSVFDISLDIELHQKDHFFASKGGQIFYIFDENLFELFVRPYKNWRNVSKWAGRHLYDRIDQNHFQKDQGMQSALIASEVLFGGDLPGQFKKRIFLTEWHRAELLDRMGELLSKFGTKDFWEAKEDAKALINAKLKVWQDSSGEQTLSNLNFEDRTLKHDVRSLLKNNVEKETILSFVRNREAALVLAQDSVIEPIQQLSRLLAPKIQKKLLNALSINKPSSLETKGIKSRGQYWARQLKSELRAQPRSLDRNQGSIWNDARSLALIEWLSSSLVKHQEKRLVFVTGDQVLYDTYRRAYGEQEMSELNPGQFILRRPIQYSSVFNNSEVSSIAGRSKQLFYSIQQTLELALTPTRLAALADHEGSNEVLKRRFSLTLAPRDLASKDKLSYLAQFCHGLLSYKDVSEFQKVGSDWEFTDRNLIGLSRDILMRRMSEDEIEKFAELAGDWGVNQKRIFEEYLETKIRQLNSAALQIWRPIAEEFFASMLDRSSEMNFRPVPIALRLTIKLDNGEVIDLSRILYSSGVEEKQGVRPDILPSHFLQSAFDVFVASCAVALNTNQWRLAEHFSGLAINSFIYLDGSEKTTEEKAAEAFYASALAKRFKMGELVLFDDGKAYSVAKELYLSAIDSLNQCEKYGRNVQKLATGDREQYFLIFRVSSERAALFLFYSQISRVMSNIADKQTECLVYLEESQKAHEQAAVSLVECLLAHHRLNTTPYELSSKRSTGKLLKKQLLINICAWYVLGSLISNGENLRSYPELSSECIRNLNELEYELESENSPLFAAEVQAFKIIQNIDSTQSLYKLSQISRIEKTGKTLAFDQKLLHDILTHWNVDQS